MTNLAFIDTETTGLDPDQHEIWEVGLVLRRQTLWGLPDGGTELRWQDDEFRWLLPVNLGKADPYALRIGRFYERYDEQEVTGYARFAKEFAQLTDGAHLVGNVVSFDEERLRRFLRRHGACPGWHYHIIDLEPMIVGYLHGFDEASGEVTTETSLPWKSYNLSRAIGIEPPEEGKDAHTALGDARWARDLYDRVVGA